MIKILFTAATSWELRVLKQEIKKLTLKNIRKYVKNLFKLEELKTYLTIKNW